MTSTLDRYFDMVNRGLKCDERTYLYADLETNLNMVTNRLSELEDNSIDKWYTRSVVATAIKLSREGKLVSNPNYVDVLRTVFNDPQFNKKSANATNIGFVIRELIRNGWPCNTGTVSQAVLDCWDQLSDDPQWLEAKRVSDTRTRQIAEMTNNGQSGFSLVRNGQRLDFDANGQRRDYGKGMASQTSRALKGAWSASESKSFDEMSDLEVDAIYQEFAQTRAFKAMSKEQLREYIKTNKPENSGASLQVPHLVQPEPTDVLINPRTGQEFSQRDLISYINEDACNARNLITGPNGRIDAGRKRRFEQIINGELG